MKNKILQSFLMKPLILFVLLFNKHTIFYYILDEAKLKNKNVLVHCI